MNEMVADSTRILRALVPAGFFMCCLSAGPCHWALRWGWAFLVISWDKAAS